MGAMETFSQDEILALLADELDAARAQLEALGVLLIGDPAVAARHIIHLQALDHVGQRCAAVADILRAADRQAASEAAPLDSIPARLRR